MSEQILVTIQPLAPATAEPTLDQVAEATVQDSVTSFTTKEQSAQEVLPLVTLGVQQNTALRRQRKAGSFRRGYLRVLRIVNKIFLGVLRVFLIVLAGISVAILFVLWIGLSFGSIAANSAMMMLANLSLIGNGILRAAHLSHYTTNRVAATIGAVGSLVATAVIFLPLNCVIGDKQDENGRPPSWAIFIATLLVGTLSGTLGAAILKHNHFDLQGTDVLHATRAGALGGAILGPGVIFLLPLVFLAIGIILSPLWIVMGSGTVEWIYTKSSETWTDDWRINSICYCVVRCGDSDDPEINAELEHLDAVRRRHRDFSDFNWWWAIPAK